MSASVSKVAAIAIIVAAAALLPSCAAQATNSSGQPEGVNRQAAAQDRCPTAKLPEPGTLCFVRPAVQSEPSEESETNDYLIKFVSSNEFGDRYVLGAGLITSKTLPATGPSAVVALGHHTVGLVPKCALNKVDDPESSASILFAAQDYITHDPGAAVVMANMPGLEAGSPPSYLERQLEGRALLDSARAAAQLNDPGVRRSVPTVAVGYSQGGHTVIAANELAKSYAPDVPLRGVVAYGPGTDLEANINPITMRTGYGVTLGSFIITTYSKVYADPRFRPSMPSAPKPQDIATSLATNKTIPRVSAECGSDIKRREIRNFLKSGSTFTSNEAWRAAVRRNRLGDTAGAAPVYLVSGSRDVLTTARSIKAYTDRACARGSVIRSLKIKGATHYDLIGAHEKTLPWALERLRPDAEELAGCEDVT